MDGYMQAALKEAKKALKYNDVPVGVVIVENDKIIAKAHNQREKKNNISDHAEIIALKTVCKKKKTWKLNNCVMYVTLEPCMMCWSAINQARIKEVYFALPQQKKNVLNYTKKIQYSGENESLLLLNKFFTSKRKEKK